LFFFGALATNWLFDIADQVLAAKGVDVTTSLGVDNSFLEMAPTWVLQNPGSAAAAMFVQSKPYLAPRSRQSGSDSDSESEQFDDIECGQGNLRGNVPAEENCFPYSGAQLLKETRSTFTRPKFSDLSLVQEQLEDSYRCPITKDFFVSPVTLLCGHSFEKPAIEHEVGVAFGVSVLTLFVVHQLSSC
jgi:hypothetical protein